VAVPRKISDSVHVENGTTECAGALPAAEALMRLRSVLDNDELTERIPAELSRAGFTRVFFSHSPPEEIPRDDSDSSAASRLAARHTVPVFAWQKPVGHLHATSGIPVHDGMPMLLRLLAEAFGTIFERNILAERVRTMNTLTREHVHEIYFLAEGFSQLEG
jgi:hypothetical protein